MTSIIVGACSVSVRADIQEFFQYKGDDTLVRVAIPDRYFFHLRTEYWRCYARVPDGRILAVHRVLKHIEFLTSDDLLDRGIAIQEMLA